MGQKKKIRVGVVFGGRSGEHEVSLASAQSVMRQINPEKYDIVPIGITKEGAWVRGADPTKLLEAGTPVALPEGTAEGTAHVVALSGDPTLQSLIATEEEDQSAIDVIFPVTHGTFGEDGALQGLLEMANVAYVGCGVLGSALGMDKEKMKLIFQQVGLPVGPFTVFRRNEWERAPETILDKIEQELGYPTFVKPANLGSSVGINKAHNREELIHAIKVAAEYDRKIVVEKGINCREFECAVLGNDEPIVSVVGEVIPSNEFYDYRAKYIDNKSQIVIPADIPQETAEQIRKMAIQAFIALDLSGLSRIDFFLNKDTGEVLINEVNTLPGFTQVSMYAMLWEASGIPYPELIDRLIELALERHEDRQRNRTSL
ncbi:D-alanine-D-alanine ligase [Thermosporothrix hazakensis]|jgi:D-alanine-D-alanine ligase|uniref:D-alanine--D-alanine ligase n=1 Tax=Thermosporothrix hazakensis TaxID=644383 RepID=A0A326UEC7_THEHA|nr:D-alanine--D-alanine ligase [Thermosporothrix hazakensis]PZW36848.1 D-alanine-D-alanine ligase [Thermosporothrix hazakensis]GCE47496.1 D-alanine--D-alanine ligase A [Thermosporothrix hazakensis]